MVESLFLFCFCCKLHRKRTSNVLGSKVSCNFFWCCSGNFEFRHPGRDKFKLEQHEIIVLKFANGVWSAEIFLFLFLWIEPCLCSFLPCGGCTVCRGHWRKRMSRTLEYATRRLRFGSLTEPPDRPPTLQVVHEGQRGLDAPQKKGLLLVAYLQTICPSAVWLSREPDRSLLRAVCPGVIYCFVSVSYTHLTLPTKA